MAAANTGLLAERKITFCSLIATAAATGKGRSVRLGCVYHGVVLLLFCHLAVLGSGEPLFAIL